MSSASSGRYQSRLFNFVHQRSRRLTEQCGRAFWHFKVATSRIAPVVLYPIYLLFQSSRATGRQMHQAVQQSLPKLQAQDTDSQPQTSPPAADTPIQQVLLLVDALPSEEAISTHSQDKTEPTNFLAFLATDTLLNGGNPRTQVSSSWRFKFFPNSHTSTSSLTHRSTPHPSPSHNRAVIQGIATQLSSRTLVLISAQNEILDILTPQQQQKLQEQITKEVADYWRYQRLAHSDKQRFTLNPYQALAFLDRTVAYLESNQAIARDATDAGTLRIKALIWAAIDYFFGPRYSKPAVATTPVADSLELPAGSKPRGKPLPHRPPSKLPSRLQLINSDVDPWLSESDLFGVPESGKISNQPRNQNTQLNPAPDWIETHATKVGYVKHPLEQLLEWLDRGMLWLEELLTRVFQWVRSSWH